MTDLLTQTFETLFVNTRFMTRTEWLRERQKGICSTDAAPACRVSHWKSAYTLWCEKTEAIGEQEDNDRFLMGRTFEEPLMQLWAHRAKVEFDSIRRNLMLRSIEHPFMLANPDGLTDDAVIEVKTASEHDRKRWEVAIPTPYQFQAMHLMIVTGRRRVLFVVAFGWNFPVTFEYEWDEDLARNIATVERDFWRRVQDNDPPDPDESESTRKTLREQWRDVKFGKTIELPDEALEEIEARELALEAIKPYKARADLAKNKLTFWLQDAENGLLDGSIVVTNRTDKRGTRRMFFPDRTA